KLLKSVTLIALRRRILRSSLRKSSGCFRFSFGAHFTRKLAHQSGVLCRAGRGDYREPERDDKGFFVIVVRSLSSTANRSFFAHNRIDFGIPWI
ncbi:hypothetical protein, partial [Aeromonas aquatica]|uniref:hypothetical protein n=1 Tax=Aeromonas aquatica TaxID=558964 RepID=UPI001EE6A481